MKGRDDPLELYEQSLKSSTIENTMKHVYKTEYSVIRPNMDRFHCLILDVYSFHQ